MRTTLILENDAYAVAKAKADHENVSLGKAASDLILQAGPQTGGKPKSRAVFRSRGGRYTSMQVKKVLADECNCA
jgi:hypothetical protein